jgi:high-affinity nickel-transport protein
MASFDINKAGFAIAAMFVAVWAAAVAFWKFGKIDRRWAPAAARPGGPEPPEEPPSPGARVPGGATQQGSRS